MCVCVCAHTHTHVARISGRHFIVLSSGSYILDAGSNKLQITSIGERFCVVVKIMEERGLEATVKSVVEQRRMPRDAAMETLTKMLGDDDDDIVVTELNVPITCPLSCGR